MRIQYRRSLEVSNLVLFSSLFHPSMVIQEISANKERLLHCGGEQIEWERVDLVASYMIMETAFSKSFGFTNTYCWWVSSMTELTRIPRTGLQCCILRPPILV